MNYKRTEEIFITTTESKIIEKKTKEQEANIENKMSVSYMKQIEEAILSDEENMLKTARQHMDLGTYQSPKNVGINTNLSAILG